MPENSLDALYQGATEFQWRPAATTNRMIIHTTDNTFWDGPMATPEGVMVAHGYTETVDTLRANQIRVFAFAATEDCSTIFNGMCKDVSNGWFTPYNGQPPIPEATDGKAWKIDDVYSGAVNLGQAIPEAVHDKYCDPYPQG
jgi:hypothetical protein